MKLEFDTIGELEQFLMFSAHIGRAFATVPTPSGTGELKHDPRADNVAAHVRETVTDNNGTSSEPAAILSAGTPAGNEAGAAATTTASAPASTDMPKRKRRTKAEMEAERTAASISQDDAEQAEGVGTGPDQDEPAGATMPLGNPFAMTAVAIQTAIDAQQTAASVASIADRAAAILNDPDAVESIAHLRACQGFIQKHGMPKYNESFTEGLNANIAIYSPEQRALHLAILESLNA